MSSADDHPEYGAQADFTLNLPMNCPRCGAIHPPGFDADYFADRFAAMALFTALAAPAGGRVLRFDHSAIAPDGGGP